MILAAGRGERMRPYTDETPKPLLEVKGKRLIEYHIESAVRAGVRDIVVNVSWHREQLIDFLGDGSRWGVKLTISDEGSVALETAGGIFNALPLLGSAPFIVINGDVWTDFPVSTLLPLLAPRGEGRGDERGQDSLAHLVLVPNPDFHPQGDFGLIDGHVVLDAPQRHTFSGIAVYRPEFFAGCRPGKFPLLPLFKRAIEARRLTGQLYTGVWNDIGTPQRLEQLRASL